LICPASKPKRTAKGAHSKSTPKAAGKAPTAANGVPEPDAPRFDERELDAEDLAHNASYDGSRYGDEPHQDNPCRFKDCGFDPPSSYARPLALEIVRRAVAEWRSSQALADRAFRKLNAYDATHPGEPPDDEDNEFQAWANTAHSFALDAERRLADCILVLHGLVSFPRQVTQLEAGWNPVSLDLCGSIYVVGPADVDDPEPRLTVVGRGGHDDADYGLPTW
jgi:hypothetical protein